MFHLKKVCYKVALCEYCPRQSCEEFTDPSVLNLNWECCNLHSVVWYRDVLIFTITGKLFLIKFARGPLDFAHPAYPIAMPLRYMWTHVEWNAQCCLFWFLHNAHGYLWCAAPEQAVCSNCDVIFFSFVINYAVLSTKHELFIWDTLQISVIFLKNRHW